MVEHWFDTRTGEHVVGEAALMQRLEQSSPGDVVLLRDLVLSEGYEYEGDVIQPPDAKVRTKQDVLNFGHWAMQLLSGDDRFRTLTETYVARLATLGAGPGRSALLHHLGTGFEGFRDEIGAPQLEKKEYHKWTRRMHVNRMRQLETELGRKPTARDLAAASKRDGGPPYWAMDESTGGTPAEINELIGYPNIRSWDDEEHFVRWGSHVMAVNDGRPLTQTLIKFLASRSRGPSPKTIIANCGNFARFQELATHRFQTDPTSYVSRDADALQRIDSLRDQKLVNAWVASHIEDRIGFVAKYDVSRDCLASLDELEHQYIVLEDTDGFMERIVRTDSSLVAEDVYLSAIATHHTDDIWRLSDRWKDSLIIGPEDVVYVHPANRKKYTSPVQSLAQLATDESMV